MVWFVLLLTAVGVLAWTIALRSGRVRPENLPPAVTSTPPLDLPTHLTAQDVDAIRFDTAPRGYAVGPADDALDSLRARLAEQEEALAAFELPSAREGRPQ